MNIDIIGNLAKSGNWFKNLREDHIILENILTNHAQNFGSVLSVDIGLYQNAGANIVQQLAYGIAHANEYLNLIDEIKQIYAISMISHQQSSLFAHFQFCI